MAAIKASKYSYGHKQMLVDSTKVPLSGYQFFSAQGFREYIDKWNMFQDIKQVKCSKSILGRKMYAKKLNLSGKLVSIIGNGWKIRNFRVKHLGHRSEWIKRFQHRNLRFLCIFRQNRHLLAHIVFKAYDFLSPTTRNISHTLKNRTLARYA